MKGADRMVGLMLVTLGVLLLVVLQTDVGGETVVAMVGATFSWHMPSTAPTGSRSRV